MAVVPVDFGRQDARQTHRRLVLSEILLNGPVARTEIARRTGLGAASVSRISRELIDADLVVEGDEVSGNRPGRKFVALDIRPDGGYVVGISMNLFQQYVSLANLKNETIARRELDLQSFDDVDVVVAATVSAVEEMLADSGVEKHKVIGGAVAITGAVDPEAGVVCSAPLLGWEFVEIGKMLSEPLGIPIHVESLANAINLAETRFGIGKGRNNVVVFNASLAIGVSMLIDNRLLRGTRSSVGIVDTLSIWNDDDGAPIALNDIAGGWSALRALDERGDITPDQGVVSEARRLLDTIEQANDGDENARRALARAGQALGDFIDVVDGLMHPDLIVVAGPLAWCPFYIRGIRASLSDRNDGKPRATLEASDMTWRAATRWLALNEFLLHRDIDLDSLAGRTVA